MSNPETEWLQRSLQGDEEAFASLVERYQNPVFNLCYRMLGDEFEAEDAAQETFWRAYQHIQRYDPQRSFATWLLSIAAHYCIDQQRKRRAPILAIDDLLEETLPDQAPDPERTASQTEEQLAMRNLLQTLNAQDRSAIILRYWYDFSEEEIARALNLSASAVKSRLFRSRQALARQFMADAARAAGKERKQDESPAF